MRRFLFVALALLLSACNLSVPQVTPTVAPSLTPSVTPVVSVTPSATTATNEATQIALLATATATQSPLPTVTPQDTATPAPTLPPPDTDTPAPTVTPSATPTGAVPPTLTPTNTLTPTITDTATATPSLSVTPSATPSATITPFPSPTDTPRPPTLTPLPLPTITPSPTDTPPATATPLPTITLTFLPTLTSTPAPPSGTPTRTLSPTEQMLLLTPIPFRRLPTSTPFGTPPTLDVTPTFITVEAPSQSSLTPLPATTTPEILPTATAFFGPPTASVPIIAQVPTAQSLPQIGIGTLAYALTTAGGFGVSGFDVGFTVDTFAQNPVNPGQYAAVDTGGRLWFVSDYDIRQIERVNLDIFTEFTWNTSERDQNDAAVTRVVWSPNGQFMAFIIHAGKNNKDGVWAYSPPGGGGQVLRDCPPQQGCETTLNRGQDGRPYEYQSLDVVWAPDSSGLLIELYLLPQPDGSGGRRAFAVTDRLSNPENMPAVIGYSYASWTADGGRVVVSGPGPDGRVVLGTVDRSGNDAQVADMGAQGFSWMQDGVQSNGRLIALGSRNGPDSPQQLVDQNGQALSDPIGGSRPERVEWSPDRGAVLVVTNDGGGRRYWVARVGERAAREITGQVASALTVEWVGGRVPGSPIVQQEGAPSAPVATPVPASAAAFAPGSQARVTAPLGLNLRSARSLDDATFIALLPDGSTVIIVEGPIADVGYAWYRVRLNDGAEGWVVAVANGARTLQ